MAKQYACYLFYGLIIFCLNSFIWSMANGTINVIPYFTFVTSVLLFTAVPILLIYYPKSASVIGFISLLFSLSGAYYICILLFHSGIVFITLAIIIILVFICGIFFSIKTFFGIGGNYKAENLSRTVKWCYTAVPLLMICAWVILAVIHAT